MKTVAIFKWDKDPQDARVSPTGEVSWEGVKFSPTDDDPAVIEVAKSLTGENGIVGVTVGDGDLAWMAARGAAETIVVDGVAVSPDGSMVASALAAAIKQLSDVDVVVVGDSEWNFSVVSALAGALGWPALFNVTAAETCGDKLRITQKSGNASRILEAAKPLVLAAKALHSEKEVPGMKQTLLARKKPVTHVAASELEGTKASSPVASNRTRLPDSASAIMIDGSNAQAAVEQLIEALRGEDVL